MADRVFSAERDSIGFPYKFKDETTTQVKFFAPNSAQKLKAQKLQEEGKPSALMEYSIEVLETNLVCERKDEIIIELMEDGDIYGFFASVTNLVEETKKQRKSA